jgi:hypothetical protein
MEGLESYLEAENVKGNEMYTFFSSGFSYVCISGSIHFLVTYCIISPILSNLKIVSFNFHDIHVRPERQVIFIRRKTV